MTKVELKSLTIDHLNGMTQDQLDGISFEIIGKLNKYEINDLSSDIKKKLHLVKLHYLGDRQYWMRLIAIGIIGAIIAVLI